MPRDDRSSRYARVLRAPRKLTIACLAFLACASSAQAAFPGTNGKLAIDPWTNQGVETINPDGTGGVLVTDDGHNGEWSPAGTKIAFERCSPTCHVWVMNPDGSAQAQVTTGSGETRPSWSPDGQRLVFTRSAGEIWTIAADGTGEESVASGLSFIGFQDAPQWSPDGSRIVFASDHRQGGRLSEIYTVRPDGTDLLRLTTATAQSCDPYAESTWGPDWSPSGAEIAYMHSDRDNDAECPPATSVRVMNADGSGGRIVGGDPDGNYIEGPAVWSPDGAKIAFDASAGTFTVPAAGGPDSHVTWDGGPTDWQPIPYRGYARPKGASPIRVSLVPAFNACTTPNSVHAEPLASAACDPPVASSAYVTVGTPDANGAEAHSEASIRLTVDVGTRGPPDDADVVVQASVTDVRCKGSTTTCGSANAVGGADYVGRLEGRSTIRITDRDNANPGPGGPDGGTVIDLPVPFPLPCAERASVDEGGHCTSNTSLDAVVPGMIREGKRAVWELGLFAVTDGGSDGVVGTQPNTTFLRQGVFVP